MARKTDHISIIQVDAHAISVLRCKLTGRKPSQMTWLHEKGEWHTTEELSDALCKFVQEQGIKGDKAYLVLPRYDVTTRFLTLPSHDMNEIAGMVRFSAEEYVPYSMEEIILDQYVLNPLDSGESHVLAALAHHEVVDKPIALLQEAGLSVERVLLSTACLGATVGDCRSEGAFALVNLTSGGIEITVFDKGQPVFSRGIATAQDWESICRDPHAGNGIGVLDASGSEELASELRGSLAAYRRESADGLGADDIYVACAYANVGNLCATLSEQTGKSCRPAEFALTGMGGADSGLPGIPLEYLGALREISGAVPPSINLLPLRETQARRMRGAQQMAVRAAIFAALILAVLGGLYFQSVYQRTRYISELERRIAVIEPNALGITEKREALNILRRQVDRKGSIVEQLARIVEAAPEERVNFSRLSFRRNEGVSLWGRAKTVSDVALFAQNIRNRAESHLAFFAEARSLYEQQTMERNLQVFSYQIDITPAEDENDF